MKKYILKPILILTILFFGLQASVFAESPTCPPNARGQSSYCLLAPLGETKQVASGNEFASYLQTIVNIAIGLTGAISVIMLIIGGLEYIFSGVSETAKKDAKDRLTNAVLGLLIALSGYLILKTINPDLLNLSLPAIKNVEIPLQESD